MSIIDGIENKLAEDKAHYELIKAQNKADAIAKIAEKAKSEKAAKIQKMKDRDYRIGGTIKDNDTLYEMLLQGIESPKLQKYSKDKNLHVFNVLLSIKTLIESDNLKINELYYDFTKLHYMENKISKKQYLKRMFSNYVKVATAFMIPVTLMLTLNGVFAIMSLFMIPFVMLLPSNLFIKRRLKKHYKQLKEICKDTSIVEMKFDEFAELMKGNDSSTITPQTVHYPMHNDSVKFTEIFEENEIIDSSKDIEIELDNNFSVSYPAIFSKSA